MNETPVARHFIPCEEIGVLPAGDQVLIDRVVYVIRAVPGDPYPRVHPPLCFFALLTNGRGSHTMAVEFVYGVGPVEQPMYLSPTFTRDFGTDPLAVHGLPIRLNNLVFPLTGQYEARLLCDGEVIAHQALELR